MASKKDTSEKGRKPQANYTLSADIKDRVDDLASTMSAAYGGRIMPVHVIRAALELFWRAPANLQVVLVMQATGWPYDKIKSIFGKLARQVPGAENLDQMVSQIFQVPPDNATKESSGSGAKEP